MTCYCYNPDVWAQVFAEYLRDLPEPDRNREVSRLLREMDVMVYMLNGDTVVEGREFTFPIHAA